MSGSSGMFGRVGSMIGAISMNDEVQEEWSKVVGPLGLSALQENAPVDTGALKESITFRVEHDPLGVQIVYEAGVPYAGFVIDGTKPHDIAPVSAQALHFITKSGDEVFATLVHHPGTKANPFPRRAYQGIREEVVGTLRDLLLENMRRNATRSESEDI